MKKLIALLLCLACFALCACGTKVPAADEPQDSAAPVQSPQTEEEDSAPAAGELSYVYKGFSFGIFDKAETVMEAIGEPMDSFTSPSCAYQGEDYFYYYDGLELTVNDIDGEMLITGITLADDTVETPQGLRLGMDVEKALELMAMDYTESNGVYSFVSGETKLLLQTDSDQTLSAIEYAPAES